ncbi:RNA ligase-domain-containing protein [Scheffersomyces amazonensis]|uniref:RNA ligase-domain-containing protein n=1 Tax=Scheffersomyces amazonensis TaxID=1078765 RepID=UPI00315DD160
MTAEAFKDSEELIEQLCIKLEELRHGKKYEKTKKFSTTLPNDESKTVDSWKFVDWAYGRNDVTLPINARGLFTIDNKAIAVRGYDKFFNIDELERTKKPTIIKNTKGPYEVTLKENGCIILIGGLPNGDLLVCSKHSVGVRKDVDRNHAMFGHSSVLNQLKEVGKTEKELGQYLYDHNLTAVAELCDDEFEEHVLPYGRDKAGLYLHGLNYNTIKFKTIPIDEVTEFANEWGFKSVESFKFDDASTFFNFFEECSKTGTYNDREVEGFVIRCKDLNDDDFFFKAKFEQPYLLYRQFREVTRKVFIEDKPFYQIHLSKNRFITKQYINFVQGLFENQPELKDQFARNLGVIKLRQLFLDNLNEKHGINLLNLDKLSEQITVANPTDITKYVIVPIATIGCGKTTVFQTLLELFPSWVHLQNDNIGKSSKVKIVERTVFHLNEDTTSAVLFDRNNSEYRERRQIFTDFETYTKRMQEEPFVVKFIGLDFIGNKDKSYVKQITYDRVMNRGDNHQSIKSSSNRETAIKVLDNFIHRFQAVDVTKPPDSQFDTMIHLNLEAESSLENVNLILSELHKLYPSLIETIPSQQSIEAAFKKAIEYKPTFTKKMDQFRQVDYYAFNVEREPVLEVIESILQSNDQWQKLKELQRVQGEFHVTLGHVSANKDKEAKPLWKALTKRFPSKHQYDDHNVLNYYGDIKLLKVVINKDKLICILVELLDVFMVNRVDPIEKVIPSNKYLHITVGTFNEKIYAYQSNITLRDLFKSGDIDYELNDGVYSADNGDVMEVINFSTPPVFKNNWLHAHF